MKRALVCGAGGFIGHHLVKRLIQEGYHVVGVDLKEPEFEPSATKDFSIRDLRDQTCCETLFESYYGSYNEVYQLAADMGGMGFIGTAECEIMRNNAQINLNMVNAAIKEARVPKYFFSSSACVYRDMDPEEPDIDEDGAYPAQPDNEYGWEKLYAERMALAFERKYGTKVYIARFENTYGPLGTWQGGREKAPAAICRKVAQIPGDEGTIDVWGDGLALRYYTYIDDLIDGIRALVESNLSGPVNIGTNERVSVNRLVKTVAEVARKKVHIQYVDGPVGVRSRGFKKKRMEAIGSTCVISLTRGIGQTYPWIEEQVRR